MQYDDATNGATSFSATVFKDTAGDAPGNLILAIRGTLERSGTPNDLTTDADIFTAGAGYDQIVAMANWWRRASSAPGQLVQQYQLVEVSAGAAPADAVVLRSTPEKDYVLRTATSMEATGELWDVLARDPDLKIDVTGHSLGGHLAMVASVPQFATCVGFL